MSDSGPTTTDAADRNGLDAQLRLAMKRDAGPVECSICDWKGRRIVARSKPCPACGAKVDPR
jgi:hypothetical protein